MVAITIVSIHPEGKQVARKKPINMLPHDIIAWAMQHELTVAVKPDPKNEAFVIKVGCRAAASRHEEEVYLFEREIDDGAVDQRIIEIAREFISIVEAFKGEKANLGQRVANS